MRQDPRDSMSVTSSLVRVDMFVYDQGENALRGNSA